MNTDIERHIQEVKETLVSAYDNWSIWWLYKNKEPKYVDVMNQYLGFFTCSISAQFVGMLMAISCLIDEKNISLISLVKRTESEGILKEKSIKEIDQILIRIRPIIKGILIIRSNVFAHISEKIDTDSAFKLASLVYDDIKNLIEDLGKILNIILLNYNKSHYGYNLLPADEDTERMLQDLIDYNKDR